MRFKKTSYLGLVMLFALAVSLNIFVQSAQGVSRTVNIQCTVGANGVPNGVSANPPLWRLVRGQDSVTFALSGSCSPFGEHATVESPVAKGPGGINQLWAGQQTVTVVAFFNSGIIPANQALGNYGYTIRVFDAANALLATSDPIITIADTVGGSLVPVNTLSVLTPFIGFASLAAAMTVLSTIYLKRVRGKKNDQ